MCFSKKDAITLCRFRICNLHLPIESGRWVNIIRNERICNHCKKQEIGDEFHYILNSTTRKRKITLKFKMFLDLNR